MVSYIIYRLQAKKRLSFFGCDQTDHHELLTLKI